MRRVWQWVLIGALVAAPVACKRERRPAQPAAAPEAARMASTIHMDNSGAAGQLVSGFHAIENNAWRWTERRFAVALGPPAGAARNGAVLELRLTVPPPSIEKLGSLTLSASAEGAALAPETYRSPGQYVYRREIPSAALGGNSVKIAFQLDKAIPPGNEDLRELGVVVSSVGLEAK